MASLELRHSIWHLRWRDRRGKSRSMSTHLHTSKQNDLLAQKKLASFEADLRRGNPPTANLRLGSMFDDVVNDYRTNKKKSLKETSWRVEKNLRPWFGEMRVDRFAADDWREYVAYRQQTAKNATINRERAVLARAFSLAYQAGRIEAVPYIPRLKEAAPRSGFIDRKQLDALCRHLPEYLRAFVVFAWLTGWRLSEIRRLQWRHIDFAREEIRLDAGTTKNDDGRVFPMTEELRLLLGQLQAVTDANVAKRRLAVPGINVPRPEVPTLTPLVFHRPNGKPIGYLYHAWDRAAAAIGKPGLLFHDLRRSFVREQRLRGMSEGEIMKLTGHRTRAVFDRYTIINESDMQRLREIMDGVRTVRKEPKGGG
jgi:integrase